jgi:VanZ family protein
MPHKMLTWSPKRRDFLIVALIAFGATEAGRFIYRPFVYTHDINDWGIADTMGNHIGAVALIFAILTVMHANRLESYIVVAVVALGYVAYEFAQSYLPGSTPDMRDAIASLVGGMIAFTLVQLLPGRYDPGTDDVSVTPE